MEYSDKIVEVSIHENPLTCDKIEKTKEGYYWRGHNKAKYKLTYYTYANEWSDRENVVYGKTLESVLKKYDKLTHRLSDIQEEAYGEDETPITTYDMASEIDYIC